MQNIYAFPMQVKEPKPGCGCVEVTEYTAQMNPTDLGHIDVKLKTGSFDGKKTVKIPVTFMGHDPSTNKQFVSTAHLEIRAESRADVAITPGTIDLGQVPVGQKATQALVVTYSGRQPGWRITEVGYRKELLDVTVDPVPAPRGSTAFQVTATLKPNVPAGALAEQIILKTNEPGGAALNVTVNAHVLAALSASTNQVKFGGVEVGQKPVERRVTLQASEPFKVTAVEGQGDGISVPLLPEDASKVKVLIIVFTPDKDKLGPVKKVLTVKTSTGKSLTLTVEGVAKEPQ